MNILFLTTHLNAGGITSYLLTLSKGFVARGHGVFIVSAGGDQEKVFENLGIRLLNLDIRTKSELSWKVYWHLPRLKTYILENNIDVIHAQTRITQVMGHFLKKMTGRPYVSTCHGFFRPRFFRKNLGAWGDRVIAISPQVRDHLFNDFKVADQRVCLAESGIDLMPFSPPDQVRKQNVRRKYGYRDDEILVGIIARFSDVKGQDLLVKAMPDVIREFPSARLLLIGHGKEEALLRRLTDELALKDHVRFHPVVSQTAEMLSLLDIVAAPSRNEGLGLSIMEAQAMGLPVVASNVGGIPSLICDGKNGILIPPENPRMIAEALVRLCRDKDLRLSLGMQARKTALECYSSERMIDKTIACYASVIRSHSAP